MKIYVLWYAFGDVKNVIGVFSSPEEASQAQKDFTRNLEEFSGMKHGVEFLTGVQEGNVECKK